MSATTIRNLERNGVIPHLATQHKLADFFGVAPSEIWRRQAVRRRRQVPPSRRAMQAMDFAVNDPAVARYREELDYDFLYGIAWAVVRAANPYADPSLVAERAAVAVRGWLKSRG